MLRWISLGFRLLVGTVVLLIGLGLIVYMASTQEKPQLKPEVFEPLLVQGMLIEPQPLERRWSGYGTARALTRSRVSPQVSGRVVRRPGWLEAGVHVESGQELFQIDSTDFEFAAQTARETIASLEAQLSGLDVEVKRLGEQVDSARDELAIARRDYERAKKAIAGGAGTDSELDQWKSGVRRAERAVTALEQQLDLIPSRRADLSARIAGQRTQLAQAEKNIERATVRAPIDGVVQSVDIEAGEWAQAGQSAVEIVNLDRMEIPLRVSMHASGQIKIGDRAVVRARLEDEHSWEGAVSRIAPDSDPRTRAMTVYVEIEQDAGSGRVLRPGQFVVGSVFEGDAPLRLVVPRRTVINGRVLVADEAASEEARVWPLAQRIADTIAREVASGTRPEVTDGSGRGLSDIVLEALRLEAGSNAEGLSAAVTEYTRDWLSRTGTTQVQEDIRRALGVVLTPEIAKWLSEVDPETLPRQLRGDLGRVRRLSVVRSIAVSEVFRAEHRFPELDDRETQWMVVEPRGGESLEGRVLIDSNLEQIEEGMMVQVDSGAES